jgi:hypothetical protein
LNFSGSSSIGTWPLRSKTTSWVPGITRARYSPSLIEYIFGSVPKNTRVGKSIRGKAGKQFTIVWK